MIILDLGLAAGSGVCRWWLGHCRLFADKYFNFFFYSNLDNLAYIILANEINQKAKWGLKSTWQTFSWARDSCRKSCALISLSYAFYTWGWYKISNSHSQLHSTQLSVTWRVQRRGTHEDHALALTDWDISSGLLAELIQVCKQNWEHFLFNNTATKSLNPTPLWFVIGARCVFS